jgi:hypothetical protein
MKPIEQDIIVFADNYFFGLSNNQLEDKMEEFSMRQGDLNQYLMNNLERLCCGEQVDLMARIVLVIEYCFNSYHVKMDMIENTTIISYVEWRGEMMKEIYESSNIDSTNFVDFVTSFGSWGQENLLAYLDNKITNDVNNEYIEESKYDNLSTFMLFIMAVVSLYQQELKKQMTVIN